MEVGNAIDFAEKTDIWCAKTVSRASDTIIADACSDDCAVSKFCNWDASIREIATMLRTQGSDILLGARSGLWLGRA